MIILNEPFLAPTLYLHVSLSHYNSMQQSVIWKN